MKSTEVVILPRNATIPKEWIKEDNDGYIVIPFPSKTIDTTYDIHIEKETGIMGCTCQGFHFHGICSHIKKLRWVLKKSPPSTRAVSIEARLAQTEDFIRETYDVILDILKDYPMTADEIEEKVGSMHQDSLGFSAHQRVSELFRMGWIEGTGELRATRRGRRATVWAVS